MKNRMLGRIERLEEQVQPEPEMGTDVIVPWCDTGFVARLLRHDGQEIDLTQEQYDEYCREHAATMRVIKPREDE